MSDIKLERGQERLFYYQEDRALWKRVTVYGLSVDLNYRGHFLGLSTQQTLYRIETMINKAPIAGTFNDTSRFIPLMNQKVLDLKTMQIINRTYEHRFTFFFDAHYDSNIDLSYFQRFLDHIMEKGDQEIYRRFLRRIITDVPTEDLFMDHQYFGDEDVLLNITESLFNGCKLSARYGSKFSDEINPVLILCDKDKCPPNAIRLKSHMMNSYMMLNEGHQNLLLAWIFA